MYLESYCENNKAPTHPPTQPIFHTQAPAARRVLEKTLRHNKHMSTDALYIANVLIR